MKKYLFNNDKGICDYPEPPADNRKLVGYCSYCGEEVYEGDEVYHYLTYGNYGDDEYCHKDCVKNMAPDELLEIAGVSVWEAVEKLGITFEEAEEAKEYD